MRDERIALAADCCNRHVRGRSLQLAAEPAKVDIDRPSLAGILIAPSSRGQLSAGKHAAGRLRQREEETKFRGCYLELVGSNSNRSVLLIHPEVAGTRPWAFVR